MREVQRATAGASTSTAEASRGGVVLFVHCLGATLSAPLHLHLRMLDGVVVPGLAFRGAQVDVACVEWVQGLTWCGVRNLLGRQCALPAWYAHQISANTKQKRSLTRS